MVVEKLSSLIIEINDLMDMEDLVDDFVTFYVAGNKISFLTCVLMYISLIIIIVHIYRSRDNIQHLFVCHLSAK